MRAQSPVSGMMSNCAALQTNNPSGYGCYNNCDETSYGLGPFSGNSASLVLCAGGANVTCSGTPACKTYTQSVTFTITAGCTYTAEAQFSKRGASCADAGMDGGDEIHISGSGGALISQYATLTSVASCGIYSVSAGINTYPTADINNGCANADGYARLVYQAPPAATAQITISYASNRCDEILTYTFTSGNPTCGVIVLPVNLIAFTANQIDNQTVLIKWATAEELNNNYFDVEYSFDGIHFYTYQRIKGQGNSTHINEYSCYFIENEALGKTPYFRLKQVDFNGNAQYSVIITVGNYISSLGQQKENVVAFYNHDADDINARFVLDYPKNIKFSLYDVSGAELYTSQNFYSEGNNAVSISAPEKPGLYVLVYQTEGSNPIHKKIMIIK
ncbi:MAG: T9SS type A sorting domain-containing protein [Bacteroidetes bacterium]|nr:T9SS type A sorting domain-containing protein [Bacteroidota bacterium]